MSYAFNVILEQWGCMRAVERHAIPRALWEHVVCGEKGSFVICVP